MEKKVYVVLCDWYWDCSGSGHEMKAFESLSSARTYMAAEHQKWSKENRATFNDEFIEEVEENEISCYEDGWYDTCHIHWEVQELEVK